MRVLGPIQVVTTSGRVLDLPSASQRRLLARLAVDAPAALRVDLLCDVLGVSPGALRTIVSRLRKGFGDTIVVASQGRYRLAAPVDAALFITLLSQAAAGDGGQVDGEPAVPVGLGVLADAAAGGAVRPR